MNATDEPRADFDQVSLNLALRDSASGAIALRQVALGFRPIIIIEPQGVDEDDSTLSFDVDATDVDGIDGLKAILELVLAALDGTSAEDEV